METSALWPTAWAARARVVDSMARAAFSGFISVSGWRQFPGLRKMKRGAHPNGLSRTRKEKGGRSRPSVLPTAYRLPLFDLRLAAQVHHHLLDLLLLGALAELVLQLGERRHLQRANVIQADHVVAEIRLDGRRRGLALLHRGDRVGERLHVTRGRAPIEVAAVVLGARILR